MSTKLKVLLGIGLYLAITILLVLVVGSAGKNDAFQPQNEFKLDPWIDIQLGGDRPLDHQGGALRRARSGLTIGVMTFIARRMQREPNRVQMAVEVAYDLTRTTSPAATSPTRGWPEVVSLSRRALLLHLVLEHARLHAAADEHRAHGGHLRPRGAGLAIYAATANISIPLALALVSVVAYHFEGVRAKGLFGYLKSWLPPGLEDMNPFGKALIF